VEDAALTTGIPFDYNNQVREFLPENPPPQMENGALGGGMARVSPGFHELMGLRMIRGRTIEETDTAETRSVAVVNQAFAETAWPGQEAIGKRLQLWKDGPWIEVVGLTETAKYVMIAEAPRPFVYTALAQDFSMPATVLIRTKGDPNAMAQDIRETFRQLDEHLPIYNVRSMDSLMGSSIFALMPMRMGAMLAGTQGAVGVLLAIMGLYAVVSFGVTQRTREIGIRMAMGADPASVVKTVLGESLRLTILGLAIGGILAVGLGFGLSKVLYGLSEFDPLVIGGITLLLFATSILACWWPARRATRINPVDALRAE
jgi:predicted permease